MTAAAPSGHRPTLSVCLLTTAPAARVAAILEPLRGIAAEVVLATDARLPDDVLSRYRALASRVFRIELVQRERHLPWLYRQCRCDWILRLDGDEVPSAAFAAALPGLLTAPDVVQYWVPAPWLDPDGDALLDAAPWSQHYLNRLVRNDPSLRVAGVPDAHAERAEPCAYLEQPVYRLRLALDDVATRRRRVVEHEVLHPGLTAPGGGRYSEAHYLPELRGRQIARRPVPEDDRDRIARALRADAPVDAAPGAAEYVPLADLDRHWDGRRVPSSAYRATIELHGRPPQMFPAERAVVYLKVRNEGTERWPWRLDQQPPIRVGYRWAPEAGEPAPDTGDRTPFPKTVDPGDTAIVPLAVTAPQEPGDHVLSVDVVHELVAWFGCDLRVPIRVAHRTDLPPAGPRLVETPPARPRRWRRRRSPIPRLLHRVWLGDAPMSDDHRRFGRTWADHHPGWEMRTWTDADLPELGIDAADAARARTASELSDLVRFAILARVGGVYADTDVECLRPLDPLLEGVDAFAALELPGRVGTAVLGSVPEHPLFVRAARDSRTTAGTGAHAALSTGPGFLTHLIEQEGGVTILGAHVFYPYGWEDDGPVPAALDGAYAVHHWDGSWRETVPSA